MRLWSVVWPLTPGSDLLVWISYGPSWCPLRSCCWVWSPAAESSSPVLSVCQPELYEPVKDTGLKSETCSNLTAAHLGGKKNVRLSFVYFHQKKNRCKLFQQMCSFLQTNIWMKAMLQSSQRCIHHPLLKLPCDSQHVSAFRHRPTAFHCTCTKRRKHSSDRKHPSAYERDEEF